MSIIVSQNRPVKNSPPKSGPAQNRAPGNRTRGNRPPRNRRASASAIASGPDAAARPDYLAHDARNWLTVLQVYCDLLRTPGSASADRGRWLDELSRAVERGHGLVASLIDTVHDTVHDRDPVHDTGRRNTFHAATPDHAPDRIPDRALRPGESLPAASPEVFPIEAPPLDLNDALERRAPLLRHLAGDRVHVAIDVPQAGQRVRIPEIALERILFNLVRNALEAMPRGGRLTLGLREDSRKTPGGAEGKIVRLQIADTGDGIPPDRLADIFEAGCSLRAPGNPMRGLGLAIVKELTGRYGGTIGVQSRPGHGTRFVVEFPAA